MKFKFKESLLITELSIIEIAILSKNLIEIDQKPRFELHVVTVINV